MIAGNWGVRSWRVRIEIVYSYFDSKSGGWLTICLLPKPERFQIPVFYNPEMSLKRSLLLFLLAVKQAGAEAD